VYIRRIAFEPEILENRIVGDYLDEHNDGLAINQVLGGNQVIRAETLNSTVGEIPSGSPMSQFVTTNAA
jgi:hypothetical protein